MSLPPSARVKFIHTHPGGNPMPRRPPRHPSSPSNRSRSLELLDQNEKKTVLPVAAEPVPLPRPRSRSLDGLLDEDGIITDLKNEESTKENSSIDNTSNIKTRSQSLNGLLESVKNKLNDSTIQIDKTDSVRTGNSETNSNDSDPQPLPRNKRASSMETKSNKKEPAKIAKVEDMRISSSSDESGEKEENEEKIQPEIRIRIERSKSEGEERERESKKEDLENLNERSEDLNEGSENKNDQDLGQERLSSTANEKLTLLKAKSCGAGLDSDDSYSSEYKPVIKGQGSLLSLPTGAEPKRKRNFMDKCVNKVRSFIKK